MALATVGSVILVRQVLVQRLDARIESELVQEVGLDLILDGLERMRTG